MNPDINMQLYLDDPIIVRGVPIQHIPVKKIFSIGYTSFFSYLNLLTIDKSAFNEAGDFFADLDAFDCLYLLASQSDETKIRLCKACELFFGHIPTFPEDRLSLIFDDFEINRDNFQEIQSVLKLRNGVIESEEEIEHPANAIAAKLLEKRKKMREKVAKQKAENAPHIDIGDLVSIVASGIGLSIFDVEKYDLFQLNNQFHRLKVFKDYDTAIQSLVHGAKKEDVQLNHWICKAGETSGD